jgi:AcrR family transcriptional regulator
VIAVTTAQRQGRAGRTPPPGDGPDDDPDDPGGFRRRLVDGLAASIVERGYRDTTVADIVRHARTSRRTFYEQFASREECFAGLLTDVNAEMVRRISAAVDPRVPWRDQVRQAVEAWVAYAESQPAVTLSWIRDAPSLGLPGCRRETTDAFAGMIQALGDTEVMRAAGVGPVPREVAVMLLGALRELAATTVEDGGRIGDLTEAAVRASVALLGSGAVRPE